MLSSTLETWTYRFINSTSCSVHWSRGKSEGFLRHFYLAGVDVIEIGVSAYPEFVSGTLTPGGINTGGSGTQAQKEFALQGNSFVIASTRSKRRIHA